MIFIENDLGLVFGLHDFFCRVTISYLWKYLYVLNDVCDLELVAEEQYKISQITLPESV